MWPLCAVHKRPSAKALSLLLISQVQTGQGVGKLLKVVFHLRSQSGEEASQLLSLKVCFVCPNRGWRWAYHDATISHRDDAVNVGWPLLLPHRHWLQLTLCAGQSWPAVPPASLFHRTQIKRRRQFIFRLCRKEALPRRGTSKHGPWKGTDKVTALIIVPQLIYPQCDKMRNTV